jgi:hypothetical protein
MNIKMRAPLDLLKTNYIQVKPSFTKRSPGGMNIKMRIPLDLLKTNYIQVKPMCLYFSYITLFNTLILNPIFQRILSHLF